jgi:drug/metabolite transporter (DMT)-like permease
MALKVARFRAGGLGKTAGPVVARLQRYMEGIAVSWLVLTLVGILVFSPKSLLYRVLMKDDQSDPYAQSVVFFGLGGTLALLFSLFRGGFQYQITSRHLLLFLPLTVCATVGPVLLFKAYQRIDASEIAILQSSQKLWSVLGAFLFLREPFSANKVLGTLVVVAGIAITLWRRKRFQVNEGIALVLVATLFYAGMDLVSYYIVRDFDPISLIVYVCYLPVVTLLLLRPQTVKRIPYYFEPKYALGVSVLALCDTVGTLCFFYAYQAGRNAAQIVPLAGLITINSVWLGIIFLGERTNIPNKVIGALVTVVGAVLVL